MSCWAERYLGELPKDVFLGKCLIIVRRILKEQFGKEYPGFLSLVRSAKKGTPPPMVEVRRPRDGSLVVFGNKPNPVRHVGIYCSQIDRVVHADTALKQVVAEPLWRLRIEWPVIGFYDVV